jgi:hypothetical protein
LAACAVLIPLAWNARGERERFARLAPLAVFAVYALVLLGKMLLHARIQHYGFVLALPATLLLVLGLVEGVPRLRRERPAGGAVARGLALGALAAGVAYHLAWSNGIYSHKRFAIGAGADRLWLEDPSYDPRPQRFARALAWLSERLPPRATLLVLPEGLSLNYWLRRESGVRYGLFLPGELRAWGGEQAVLAELRAHPPDWVALLDRAHEEFAAGAFGADAENGRELLRWVEQHYRRELRIGPEPFRGEGFGIVLLSRVR